MKKHQSLPQFPPMPIHPGGGYVLDLGGAWSYSQPVTDPLARVPVADSVTFQAPGEIIMQGLPFDPDVAFVLERVVAIPQGWSDCTIRIRFESVYSACTIWIDGKPAGHHLGANTPFDIDISSLAAPGVDVRITLHIENNSIADTLANGSKYAAHALAGIPRKVTLYALPQAHLQTLDVTTTFFDGNYQIAQLNIELAASVAGPVSFQLTTPDEQTIQLGTRDVGVGSQILTFDVPSPQLWDTENPRLYTLRTDFGDAHYSRRFGFRDIATRDGRLYLNGVPIILRGVNHHETHPITGRADTAKWGRQDAQLFRSAHVNLLRTSHYPPTIELVEACDELGMLLEVEAPVCFAFGQFGHMPKWEELSNQLQTAMSDYVLKASLEMVAFYRSNPSVVIWSIGNESRWAPPFERSAAAISAVDPTRPLTFNWYKNGPECRDHVQIANHHYPDSGEVERFKADPRPVMFDEFAHLYCYNGHELATDPGLRLRWGDLFAMQWEEVLALPNGIGGSIWAGIDDYFSVPQRDGTRRWLGYGQWGPLDGWRRKKPEFQAMKRVFDPVHLPNCKLERVDGSFSLTIVNRFDFANLSEVECTWRAGDRLGQIELNAAPGESTTILFGHDVDASAVKLRFRLPRLDYVKELTLLSDDQVVAPSPAARVRPLKEGKAIRLGGWLVTDSAFGPQLRTPGGDCLPLSLAVIPAHPSWAPSEAPSVAPDALNNAIDAWKGSSLRISADIVEISGAYNKADGAFALSVGEDGGLVISYDFILREGITPLQTGVSLSLPLTWDTLKWQLSNSDVGLDDEHLGRARGRADPHPEFNVDANLPTPPHWPWSHDTNHLGSNDFRSTKLGIEHVALTSLDGRGVSVLSDGSQNARAQMGKECVTLLVLDYTSQGSERFLESYATPLVLENGARLSGTVRLVYQGANSQ